MSLLLRRLLDRLALTPRTPCRPARRRDRRVLPLLEVLENRLTPAAMVASAPDVWSGAGGNADWTNSKNWVGGAAPSAGQALEFPTTAVSKSSYNDCKAGTAFGPITIDGSGYTISGNPVTLQGGLTADNTKGANTVSLPLTLSAPEAITAVNTGTTLTLGGNIDNGGKLLTVNGGGYVLFTGSSITGAGGLTTNDTTRVLFLNTKGNTYSGTTTVNDGTVYLGDTGGNAIAGNLVIGDNVGGNEADVVRLAGNNQLSSKSAVTITSTGLLDLNGYTNTLGPLTMTGGNLNTGTGTVTLSQGMTTEAPPPQAPHADAVITGNLSLGSSTQTFNVANGGSGLDLDLKATLSGGPGAGIDKTGDGTMQLSGSNSYTGPTEVQHGVLVLDNAQSLGNTSSTTVDSGGTLQLQGGVTFNPAGTLTLNGAGYQGEGALDNAAGNNAWDGKINLASTATVAAAGTLTLNGVLSGPNSSNLKTQGPGTVVLTGTNTNYEGYTVIQSGTLVAENAAALGGAPYNGGAGTTVDSGATLQLVGGISYNIEPLILNGTGVGGTAGALESVSGNNTWTGPMVLNSAATIKTDAGSTFTDHVQIANEGCNLTVDGGGDTNLDTTISGAGGLIKNGSGTLTLGGSTPNLYTGPTTVNAGTLDLAKTGGANAIAGSGLTISKGATLSGSGTIATSLTNSGTVTPGGANTIGTLVVTGNYTQNPGAALDVEMASKKAFDQLMIQGSANLAGVLNGSLLNGYEPGAGDMFPVVTFNSSSGKFGKVNLPNPDNGVVLSPIYDPQDFTIEARSSS